MANKYRRQNVRNTEINFDVRLTNSNQKTRLTKEDLSGETKREEKHSIQNIRLNLDKDLIKTLNDKKPDNISISKYINTLLRGIAYDQH